MLLTVFEHTLFFQALGWGILNSLWQMALLWALLKVMFKLQPGMPALLKYNTSLVLFFAGFAWFIATCTGFYMGAAEKMVALTSLNQLLTKVLQPAFFNSLAFIYCFFLLFHITGFIRQARSLQVLRKSPAYKVPASLRVFTERTAVHMGIPRKVQIWLSEKVDVPAVIGFFKPIILLPVTGFGQLSTEQAEAIILHELAHIRRNDYLVNLLQSLVEMLLFFNPFARSIGNLVRLEREHCCDDWVINYQYNRELYAHALLQLEMQRSSRLLLAPAATNGKAPLLCRIKRLVISEPVVYTKTAQKLRLLVMSMLLLVMILVVLPYRMIRTETAIVQPLPVASYTSSASTDEPAFSNEAVNTAVVPPIPSEPLPVSVASPEATGTAIVPESDPEPAETYELAVNESMLNNEAQLQQVAMQAIENTSRMIVKVEEEQSGTADKKAYLFELNNINGQQNIRPLMILNKKVAALTKKMAQQTRKTADSLRLLKPLRTTS